MLVWQSAHLFYDAPDTISKGFKISMEPMYSHNENLTADFKVSLDKAIKYILGGKCSREIITQLNSRRFSPAVVTIQSPAS